MTLLIVLKIFILYFSVHSSHLLNFPYLILDSVYQSHLSALHEEKKKVGGRMKGSYI
jgi:hypothetical protein